MLAILRALFSRRNQVELLQVYAWYSATDA